MASNSTQPVSKKSTKTTKANSDKCNGVLPEFLEQMIAEATCFKALNRGFDGYCCVTNWLEAET